MISRYVVETNDGLYNTMTKEILSKNSSIDLLKEKLFLKGQEKDALYKRIFSISQKHLCLRIIPTWECNLRCDHCSVLSLLKKRDECLIEPNSIIKFCKAYRARYGDVEINLLFLGGEALLRSKECLDILKSVINEFGEKEVKCTITTNLSVDLDEYALEFLSMCYDITISVDGVEEQHNWQRKPLDKKLNPYKKTLCNLFRLNKIGISDKVIVQAAVQQKMYDEKKYKDFYRSIMKTGIKKIKYGCCHPTKQNPEPDDLFISSLKISRVIPKLCCDYRYMSFFTINNKNELIGDYFGRTNVNHGNIKNFDFDKLEFEYKQKIIDNLNIMRDKTCMEECPVVAFCWGGCQNNDFIQENPSKTCGREGLEQVINKMAKEGTLTDKKIDD
jgi:radical SAM protein with 4Fe4S-binding SPASM domain